ncbi:zinc finger protein 85-like [Copidosoma floridanum]|uniref:zinc finger protein 85-like n=1 Tax=Copidosoma floridanum TaxID=29053 RepID=UPI000C6FAE3E|nr:zinc finger protein 85-like [Copidosoma floridanum]
MSKKWLNRGSAATGSSTTTTTTSTTGNLSGEECNKLPQYECTLCQTRIKQRSSYRRHMRDQHDIDVRIYRCGSKSLHSFKQDFKDLKFMNVSSQQFEELNIEEFIIEDTKIMKISHQLALCYSLMEHFDGRSDVDLKCPDCGKSYQQKSSLVRHQKSRCGTVKPYVCERCLRYVTDQLSNLERHLKSCKKRTLEERQYQQFVNSKSLISHSSNSHRHRSAERLSREHLHQVVHESYRRTSLSTTSEEPEDFSLHDVAKNQQLFLRKEVIFGDDLTSRSYQASTASGHLAHIFEH